MQRVYSAASHIQWFDIVYFETHCSLGVIAGSGEINLF